MMNLIKSFKTVNIRSEIIGKRKIFFKILFIYIVIAGFLVASYSDDIHAIIKLSIIFIPLFLFFVFRFNRIL